MELKTDFQTFLSEIRPTEAQRKDLQDGHKLLRERLNAYEGLKDIIVSDFLQGSYRRATAVRPTGSANRAYLLWKIREAQRGRVPVGPRRGCRSERSAIQVLPFRLRSELVTQLDEAWQRLGLRNRMGAALLERHA